MPPPGAWSVWLINAGRGFGKTRTGAEYVIERARQGFGPIGLIGETAADVRDVMVENGPASILEISDASFRPIYEPSKRRLTWPNGVTATTFSGDRPDQLRGPQHATVWADEPAKWRYAEDAWDNMEMGLRVGDDPKAVATTTPRPIKLIRDLVEQSRREGSGVVMTTGSTYDNIDNLSGKFRDRIVAKYEGTRLGRQELHAELLLEAEGALWTHELIEAHRVAVAPDGLTRVVVGVDPSGGAAEIGIVVAGLLGTRERGHVYVLRDETTSGSPQHWAKRAVRSYIVSAADRIVAEKNFGGDMVLSTIEAADPRAAVSLVTASRGKAQRAEPVAALYEQGRVHHVGAFPKMEDEMTFWEPGSGESPNRMDALVWAITDLVFGGGQTGGGFTVPI